MFEFDDLLALLGDADRLADSAYRQALASQVVEVLRGAIAAIHDPVDRRIAQAVLAAAPEFYDKLVSERTAYVASHDLGFTDDQFKTRRGQVIADLAETLQTHFSAGPAIVDGAPLGATVSAASLQIPSSIPQSFEAHPSPTRRQGASRPHFLRSRRLLAAGVVVLGTLAGVAAGYGLDRWPILSRSQPDSAVLATTFDDKDPRGLEGNLCADAPQSQPAYPPGPDVIGPDGTVVGTIQLRTWHSCEVVWPRIVWDSGPDLDTNATYQIPIGWTLHVLTVRPATNSTFDYPEPASGAPVPYALGKMASTTRDCVYVEVYFTNGAELTPSVRTDCIRHDSADGLTR